MKSMNVIRYRMLRGTLDEYRTFDLFFGDAPICSIDNAMLFKGAELEERAGMARTIIDRARFLAKHARSKYTPHVGDKQIKRGLR